MILLDTNVVSAVMASAPPAAVLDWLNGQPTDALFLSAITLAEIWYGLEALPDGRRRRSLESRFDRFVARGFAHRILPFEQRAARLYGELMAHRRSRGRPMSPLDGQIAATAQANRMALATRNLRDFEHCGLELVNPFTTAP